MHVCCQGDVYHLLHDLGEWLDGRVWPRTDELEVLRLRDLIKHVTGLAGQLVLCIPHVISVVPACAGECCLQH